MEGIVILKFLAALVCVVSLLLLCAWALKRSGVIASMGGVQSADRRLKVLEYMPIDHRRKLVLVRCDDKEHLLLLGAQSETVVESGMVVPGSKHE